nr:RNA-directed DNA polymerase, eukaryota [Tanacetum cinerariifolium]
FRPISLIGSLYKIIAKILANRLVTVLGDVINEIQSAFVADRQILDGPFILNEVLQWCKLKKKQSFSFKIDFENSYDSVRWDYLEDVLKKFGFGEKWCKWIRECLRSSWGSVIVNGSPTEEFQFFKGLKQGDPLSSFLFILIMESLHLTFQNVVDADDAMFVGQWSNSNIDTIIYALKCFERASGLCSKVGGCMSRIQNWNDAVENMSSRLSKWKMKTLSIGGRLNLIKAVLGAMPIYHMSIFKARVISAIHGNDGKIGTRTKSSYNSLWRDIVFEMEAVKDKGADLFSFMQKRIGDGVDTLRRLLDDIRLSEVSSQTRWIKAVPIKVNILAWKVRLNGLPSRVNISRRGIDINSILCHICEREVESVSHVFSLAMLLKTILKRFFVGGMWISRRCRHMMSGYCGFQALGSMDRPSMERLFDDVVLRTFYWIRYRCKLDPRILLGNMYTCARLCVTVSTLEERACDYGRVLDIRLL